METAANEHALLYCLASGLGVIASLAHVDYIWSVIVLHVFQVCVAIRQVVVGQSPCPVFVHDVVWSKCLGLFVYHGVFTVNAFRASLVVGLVIH